MSNQKKTSGEKEIEAFGKKRDIFKRENFAKQITKIIFNYKDFLKKENKSLVIAIDSPWGTGKTTFINMWNEALENESWITKLKEEIPDIDKYTEIKTHNYNAWENDDWDDALVPIINKFSNKVVSQDKLNVALKTVSLRLTKKVGVGLLLSVLKNKFGINVEDVLKSAQESGVTESLKNGYNVAIDKYSLLEDYQEFITAKTVLFDELNSLSEGKNEINIFFIDELDRCKPDFAIKTLEAIKHFVNMDKFIYIIAVDFEQLSHSIKTVYGNGMDAEGYLQRFIDLKFNIPTPDLYSYIFDNVVIFDEVNKHLEYRKSLSTSFSWIAKHFKFSIRDVNIILNSFKILLSTELKPHIDQYRTMEIYFYLLALKYKDTNTYTKIFIDRFVNEKNPQNSSIYFESIKDKYYKIPTDISNKSNKTIDKFMNYLGDNTNKSLNMIHNKDNNKMVGEGYIYNEKKVNSSNNNLEVSLYTLGITDISSIENLGTVLHRKIELFDFRSVKNKK